MSEPIRGQGSGAARPVPGEGPERALDTRSDQEGDGRRRGSQPAGLGGLLALLALTLAGVTHSWGQAAPTDEQVQLAADLEMLKGHLLASRELYARGEEAFAAIHAAHPIQELWSRLRGPLNRLGGDVTDRLGALLERPGREIEAKVPKKRYEETVRRVLRTLDDAATRVVPTEISGCLPFRAKVIRELLAQIEEEYEEAFRDGTIVQIVEYQDAYGFFRRARTLYQDIAREIRRKDPKAANEIVQAMTMLRKGFAGVLPPETPMPAAKVKGELQRVSGELGKF